MKRVSFGIIVAFSLILIAAAWAFAQTVGNNANPSCGSNGGACGNGGGPKIVGNGSYTCSQGNGHNGEKYDTGGCTPPPTGSAEGIVPIHAYVATSTVAGAGYDPGATVDQSVLYEAQFTWGDTGGEDATVRNTDCPSSQTKCHPMGYVDMMLADCGDSIEDAWYSQAYGNVDVGEFTHTTTPYSNSTRYYWTTSGSCTPTGGTSGGVDDEPINPANATSNAWWLNNYFKGASYVNSDTHVWTMGDDYSYIRHSTSSATGTAYQQEDEFAQATGHGPATWRNAQRTQLNYMAPYDIAANALGPGSGVYQGNNKCTASSCPVGSSGTYLDGIYNWTVDTADLCSGLSSNVKSLIHEKPFAWDSSGTLVGELYNVKIVVNTDSQVWANCTTPNIEWLNFTGVGGTDAPALRYVTKAVEGLAEPTGFNGARTSQQIVEWQYTKNIDTNTQLGVMPENFLVFTNPTGFGATLSAFKWGSTGSSGTDDSNGCQAGADPSTGGIIGETIQATCGHDGTDSAGYNAGVQAREFNDCYQAGVDKGKCAVVINTGTTTVPLSYLSAALTNWSSYTGIWQYSGTGPMNVDPLSGGTICPSANGCDGAIGAPAAIPSGGIPACTWSNMVTSPVCAWVLVSWSSNTTAVAYHGVQIFSPTDVMYQDISSAATDANSTTIIGHLSGATLDMANNFVSGNQVDEAVNIATNATPTYPLTGSHSPPKANATPEPYASGFVYEKTFCPTCSDGHYFVLNTDNHKEWDDYQWTAPSGGSINVGGGHVWNLDNSLASQYGPAEWTGGAFAGDMPEICCALISDRDAYGNANAVMPINHGLVFYAAEAASATWGYVRPANSSTGVGPCGFGGTTNCYQSYLIYGDRLRLKASSLSKMTCYNHTYSASTCPQASAIADAMVHYGIFFDDTDSSTFGVRMYNNPDGTSSWTATDVEKLDVFTSNDFDVVDRSLAGGLICPSGKVC